MSRKVGDNYTWPLLSFVVDFCLSFEHSRAAVVLRLETINVAVASNFANDFSKFFFKRIPLHFLAWLEDICLCHCFPPPTKEVRRKQDSYKWCTTSEHVKSKTIFFLVFVQHSGVNVLHRLEREKCWSNDLQWTVHTLARTFVQKRPEWHWTYDQIIWKVRKLKVKMNVFGAPLINEWHPLLAGNCNDSSVSLKGHV